MHKRIVSAWVIFVLIFVLLTPTTFAVQEEASSVAATTLVRLEPKTLQVGEAFDPNIADLLNGEEQGALTFKQTETLLRADGNTVTGVFPGTTTLSIYHADKLMATQNITVTDAELPTIEIEVAGKRIPPLSDLLPAIGDNMDKIKLKERGTNLLKTHKRKIRAISTGTALVDVLLADKRMGSFLVNVLEPGAKADKLDAGKAMELDFGESSELELNETSLLALDENIVSANQKTLMGLGTGETTLYEMNGDSIVSQRRVEVQPPTLEQTAEVALGKSFDISTLLSSLPGAIEKDKLSLLQPSSTEALISVNDMTISGLLPGTTELTLLYQSREALRIPIEVQPADLPTFKTKIGIHTSMNPTELPGLVGTHSQLSLKEDVERGKAGKLIINGLSITASRPGETSIQIFCGKVLAATMPVQVESTTLPDVKLEMGTNLTLQTDDLPGYTNRTKVSLKEDTDSPLLSFKGLRMTGNKPGNTTVIVMYGDEEAARIKVEVTKPIFSDIEIEVGERYELQGVIYNAKLEEVGESGTISIRNRRITGEQAGEATIQVFYGEENAGKFKVRIKPAS